MKRKKHNKKIFFSFIKIKYFFILFFFFVPLFSFSAENNGNISGKKEMNYKEGEIVIKLKDDIKRLETKNQESKTEEESFFNIYSLDELGERNNIIEKSKVFLEKKETKLTTKSNQKNEKESDLSLVYKIQFSKEDDIEKILEDYKNNSYVEYAELNYFPILYTTTPNDTYFASHQWALPKIEAEEAWDIETGSSDIVVAVIDTGINYNHSDLSANMWSDGSGGYGYDYVDLDNLPMDGYGHGTHVAGVISAVTNNNRGVAGVNWRAKLMALRIFDDNGDGVSATEIANAIIYATNNGAKIISNSWGYSPSGYLPSVIETAIDYANSNGVILFFASGNENTEVLSPSSGYSKVVTVASTDSEDKKASTSNYGSWIDVSAPGENILSTYYITDSYISMSGTSMATPFVSGLASILLSYNEDLTRSEIWNAIVETADNIDAENPTYIGKLGAGRINMLNALLSVSKISITSPKKEDPFFVKSGGEMSVVFEIKTTAGTKKIKVEIYKGETKIGETGEEDYIFVDGTNTITKNITVSGEAEEGSYNVKVFLEEDELWESDEEEDAVVVDNTAPINYTVLIDQTHINNTNKTAFSFTFASAEVGTTYNYSINDEDAETEVIEGEGTITEEGEQITGIDVSSLSDGTLTLTTTLTDTAENVGAEVTDTVIKDVVSPIVTVENISISGSEGVYKIGDIVVATWNNSEEGDNNTDISTVKVDFSEFGALSFVDATTSDEGATYTASYEIISGSINGVAERNVSIVVTDVAGNETITKDDTGATVDNQAPTGYTVTIDQNYINAENETNISFSFIGAEVGASYNYSFDDTNELTDAVTGSGLVTENNQQITGIDASSFDDDVITLIVVLTDTAGNVGVEVTDTAIKEIVLPTITTENIIVLGNNGEGGVFKKGDVIVVAWNNSETGDNNTDIATVTVNFSEFGGGGAVVATEEENIWTAEYNIVDGVNLVDKKVSVTATDTFGNSTTISDDELFDIDTEAPTATLVSTTESPTNGSIEVTVTFSNAVTEIISENITVTNGLVGSFVMVDDSSYTFDVIPTEGESVTVTIQILAGVTTDVAGNQNTASNILSYISDTVLPTIIEIAGTANEQENDTIVITFSEEVISIDGWENALEITNDGKSINIERADFDLVENVLTITLIENTEEENTYLTRGTTVFVTSVVDNIKDIAGNFMDTIVLESEEVTFIPGTYTVTLKEKNSIVDVEITIYTDEEKTEDLEGTFLTNALGEVEKNLESNEYWFTATKTGYRNYSGNFVVDGEEKTVEFEMRRVSSGGGGGGSFSSDDDKEEEEEVLEENEFIEEVEEETEEVVKLTMLKEKKERAERIKLLAENLVKIATERGDDAVKSAVILILETAKEIVEKTTEKIEEKEKKLTELNLKKERINGIKNMAENILLGLKGLENQEIKEIIFLVIEKAEELKERVSGEIELI